MANFPVSGSYNNMAEAAGPDCEFHLIVRLELCFMFRGSHVVTSCFVRFPVVHKGRLGVTTKNQAPADTQVNNL